MRSVIYRIVALGLCAGTAAAIGCSSRSGTPSQQGGNGEDTGLLSLDLQAAPGVTIDTVNYKISGPNGFDKSGPIDVTNSLKIAALIGGIPAATGYTIQLSADAVEGGTSCNGQAGFDIQAAATTDVTVHLQCHGAHKNGSVQVNGSLNICPNIDELSIIPNEVLVGHPVQLTAAASDADNGPSPVSFSWTASSGTIGDPSAAHTTFTCTQPGAATITLNVSDGDCGDTATGTVTCDGAAVDGGAADAAADVAVSDAGAASDVVVVAPDGAVADAGVTSDAAAPVDAAASDAAGGGADITGTWASEIRTSGSLTVPVIGTQTANIDIVLRMFVARTAGQLSTELDICRLNTDVMNQLTVNFPASALAFATTTANEPDFTATVGGMVPVPSFTILLGEDASGASVDQDMDGNAGVTVPVTLLGSPLSSFVGLKITTQLSATLQNATTIAGTANFSASGTVFGSTPTNLSGPISVMPSSPSVSFTSTHMSGNVPCSQVLTQFM